MTRTRFGAMKPYAYTKRARRRNSAGRSLVRSVERAGALGSAHPTAGLDDRADDIGRGRILHQGPVARLQGVTGHDLSAEVDDRRASGPSSAEPASDLDAVQAGHAVVEDEDVGPKPKRQRDRVGAVHGLPDDHDAGIDVQDRPEAGPDRVVIVGDEDPDRVCCAHSPTSQDTRRRTTRHTFGGDDAATAGDQDSSLPLSTGAPVPERRLEEDGRASEAFHLTPREVEVLAFVLRGL